MIPERRETNKRNPMIGLAFQTTTQGGEIQAEHGSLTEWKRQTVIWEGWNTWNLLEDGATEVKEFQESTQECFESLARY